MILDADLFKEVSIRLDADADLDPEVRGLIDAAMLDQLDFVIDGGSTSQQPTERLAAFSSALERCYRNHLPFL